MPRRAKKTQKTQVKQPELVTVTLAEDIEQAKEYERLLKQNNIPAAINDDQGAVNIPIVVPAEYLEEAQIVLDSLSAFDDFYDLDYDEEYDHEFDDDFLEDEF
jgi:hypothetical protein